MKAKPMTPDENPQIEYRATEHMEPGSSRFAWGEVFWARLKESDAGWFWGIWVGFALWGLGASGPFFREAVKLQPVLGQAFWTGAYWAFLAVSMGLLVSSIPLSLAGRKHGFVWTGNSLLFGLVGIWAFSTLVSLGALTFLWTIS